MHGLFAAELAVVSVPLAGLLGLLIGSFLNVCIYRLPRDLSVISPRSFCLACDNPIAWHDNIPVLSYLLLRGRCRRCAHPIGIRYAVVELSTAILFALTAAKFGVTLAALKWLVFEALLVVLFFTDLEERLLPNELTLGGLAAGFVFALTVPLPSIWGELLLPDASWRLESLVNAALGAAFLSVVPWLLGALVSYLLKRPALGLGDVKLLALIGAFLGVEQGISAILIASLAGSVLGIAYILWKRQDPRSYALPFGTFCCAGAALMPFVSIGSQLSGAVR
jgi:leader peptidase (prepilin peptidase)/N-methyltransferase